MNLKQIQQEYILNHPTAVKAEQSYPLDRLQVSESLPLVFLIYLP